MGGFNRQGTMRSKQFDGEDGFKSPTSDGAGELECGPCDICREAEVSEKRCKMYAEAEGITIPTAIPRD